MDELSVLIIEDDEIAAEIIQKMVQHHRPQARVAWCWNGYEALVRIQEVQPDVIFLDYMMPKLDGLEFLNNLRHLEPSKPYLIAIVSAYVDKLNDPDLLALGVDAVMPKPISIEQIENLLNQVEEKRKAAANR